jgi:hypothetical protein
VKTVKAVIRRNDRIGTDLIEFDPKRDLARKAKQAYEEFWD